VSWEQRNADFCKAQTDAQMAYIEAEREVDRLQAENTKLRAERDHMWALRDTWQENDAKLREENERLRSVVSDGADNARELRAENAKLRELCTDMWSYINAPVNQRNSLKERLAVYDDLADRMRELGVDDG